jgi:H+/Cl- antiporter ClcA
MPSRPIYAIVGVFVVAAVDLLINLLAAAIQQRAFADQFSKQSVWWLVAVIVGGLLVGYWLGGPVRLSAPHQPEVSGTPKTVTITRLRALLSYAKLRGRGIHLSDIFLFGSHVDIDTRD